MRLDPDTRLARKARARCVPRASKQRRNKGKTHRKKNSRVAPEGEARAASRATTVTGPATLFVFSLIFFSFKALACLLLGCSSAAEASRALIVCSSLLFRWWWRSRLRGREGERRRRRQAKRKLAKRLFASLCLPLFSVTLSLSLS